MNSSNERNRMCICYILCNIYIYLCNRFTYIYIYIISDLGDVPGSRLNGVIQLNRKLDAFTHDQIILDGDLNIG